MSLIGGVDEAGRGPLAGAVYAACVILDPHRPILGLKDSKKLSAAQRDDIAQQIRAHASAWAVAFASAEEIDQHNILRATMIAMRRAVMALTVVPTEVLVDGNRCPHLPMPSRAIVKGDALEPCISAASILAKTARDADMLVLHEQYPCYGFDQHKGYPTAAHLAAIKTHGISPVHRRSFGPVRALLGGPDGKTPDLFGD